MKKFLLTAFAFACLATTNAQVPDDVLRYSYFPQQGSARSMAIGGAMGSLGGDISSLFTNPAGLGLYKTSEFVITPGILMNNNKFKYRGTDASSEKSGFNVGTTGFVVGFNTRNSKWTSQAFSIGINQTANFNNVAAYRGSNSTSSYSEVFAEEISKSGLSINEVLNDRGYAFGSAPALYSYLVDTFRHPQRGLEVRGLPEFLLDKGIALDQQKRVNTKGGIYEVALGYAANMEDRLYLGAGIGIPFVNYTRNTFYKESDPTNDRNNNFESFELNDKLSTTGAGVNARLGMIYKPAEFVRLGLTLTTPTFYSLTDRQSNSFITKTEGYYGTVNTGDSVAAGRLNFPREGETKYTASTPWKVGLSGSYVFREINDTRRQRAFLTADVEYVGYAGARFGEDADYATGYNEYYEELRTVIQDYYKGAFNFRLGGELKFHTLMVRAGAAYYGNPYRIENTNGTNKDDIPKASRFIASGGLGYRNHGIFIDLTYAHTFNQDVNFPYRLSDNATTFAKQTGSIGNLMLTLGFKL